MITTVLFDFVNTIGVLSPSREELLQKFCSHHKLVFPNLKKVQKAFLRADKSYSYSSVLITKSSQRRAFYENYNKELFKQLDLEKSNDFFNFYCEEKKTWTLDDSVLDLFSFLTNHNIKIGVLSNFDNNLDAVLQKLGILHQIDYLYVSGVVGVEKPDPLFYKGAIDEYNIDTSTSLYVGDSYDLDYKPAKSVGLNCCLIDRHNIISEKVKKINCLSRIKELIHAS